MTEEEFRKEAREDVDSLNGIDLVSSTMIAIDKYGAYKIGRYDGYLAGAEPREKRIEELEAQISILLSCKNCPENKGGLICAKEYENKCLAQKIEFIKELQKENAELRLEKGCESCTKFAEVQLTKAKEIIREYSKWECEYCDYKRNQDYVIIHCSQCQKYSLHKKAEQFLKDLEK